MSCIIASCPYSVVACVLSEWLSLPEVARLDRAICDHRSRGQYLQAVAISRNQNDLKLPHFSSADRFIDWLADRKMKVQASSLTMPLMWLHAERLNYLFALIGPGLRTLRYEHPLMHTHFRIPTAAVEHCKVLHRVDLTGDLFGSELGPLFEIRGDAITELRVDVKYAGAFAHNLELLRNLKVLYIKHCGVMNVTFPASLEELVLLDRHEYKLMEACPASCKVLVLGDPLVSELRIDITAPLWICPLLDTMSVVGIVEPNRLVTALQRRSRPWKALRIPRCQIPLQEKVLDRFFCSHGASLEHLDLPLDATATLLGSIAKHCPHLEGLCLTGFCSPEAVASLGLLFRACPHLREVCIVRAPLSDAQLQDLIQHCPQLECLHLPQKVHDFTAAAMQSALQLLPRLKEVALPRAMFPVSQAVVDVLSTWAGAGPSRLLTTAQAVPALPFWRKWVQWD